MPRPVIAAIFIMNFLQRWKQQQHSVEFSKYNRWWKLSEICY